MSFLTMLEIIKMSQYYYSQRTELYAYWELEFRLLITATD